MILSMRGKMIAIKRLAGRLARDAAGNTLAIVAAAIIPLAALVGSGIDMSRAYMAQSRLQMACDAAALAGRRAMTTGVVDATVRSEAQKFFRFNFDTGETGNPTAFKVANFTPTITDGANSAVVISASTTVPTTLMSMFGYNQVPISVTCNAKQDFVNTDVMLVLDTTGSMLDDVNGVAVNGGPTSKIASLRTAVLALYGQLSSVQTQLEAVGLRLRYGIVPYSSSVNVGDLIRQMNPSYINDSADYQSRVANYTTPLYIPTDSVMLAGDPLLLAAYPPGTQTYKVTSGSYNPTGTTFNLSDTNCANFGANASFSVSGGNFSPSPAGATLYDPDGPAGLTTTQPAAPTGYVKYQFSRLTATWSNGTTKPCDRTVVATRRTYSTRYSFTNWTYTQDTYDTSNYKTGNPVTVASNTNGTVATSGSYNIVELPGLTGTTSTTGINSSGSNVTIPALTTTTMTWGGCIEERQTDNTLNSSSGLSAPSGAYDLHFDFLPFSPETRWKPHWADIEYLRNSTAASSSGTAQKGRNGSDAYVACPSPAKRLQAWTLANLTTYLNSLTPIGGTYHDIGMIWGARLLSRTDIFATDNPKNYNNMPTSRYLIFLTDGAMAPNTDSYSSYGIELLDQRVTGSSSASGQLNDHKQRFKMACEAIKSMEVEVWVVGFAQALDSSLTGCATDTSKANTFTTPAALTAQFVKIGKDIGALRLTK
jgi:Flp pilus assembly protein TadG